jgi:acetyl-CoA carboxylase biotin carboxylase subunit
MFQKVLVANRGAVAARVIRALHQLGIESVAIYSEADRDMPYLAMASETYEVGPAAPGASYLNQDAILEVLSRSKADAVHPGYGFLSENPQFARRVTEAGAAFIGPSPRWIEAMGHKTQARKLMAEMGMPMCQSSGILSDDRKSSLDAANKIGFPVLIKPATGGGGIGMLAANNDAELEKALERASSLAMRSFGNAELYLEKLLLRPRHVEFQILADRYGNVRHLFERDCSVQRRHQKVIEEAPAPQIDRAEICAAADRMTGILAQLGYDIIGTVETLYDPAAGFSFLEMNTRLQVEHAVTEEITGIDLVQSQIRLAAGERLDAVLPEQITCTGHALEVRVYAEDPKRFLPSPGRLDVFRPPQGPNVRIETGYAEGNTITPYYDPMIAKLVARGSDRTEAIGTMLAALDSMEISGVKTNIPFARQMLLDEQFRAGAVHTQLTAEVLARA